MDRFKFRGWDKPSDIFPDGCMSYYDIRQQIGDVDIIMQCTGLEDKNGKVIYEGDILWIDDRYAKKIVKWHNGGFVTYSQYNNSPTFYERMASNSIQEIVGNIHQNKDLLND